jgi:acyl-coenzyme A synthetase/AMP-(fatty) acid ligase
MRLRERLAANALADHALIGAATRVRLDTLARDANPIGTDLSGRNVLLATNDQSSSACALLALDGTAARVVICPPDVAPTHIPTLVTDAAIDTIVCDAVTAVKSFAESVLPLVVIGDGAWSAGAATNTRTEWVMLTSGTTGAPKMVVHTLDGLTGAIKPSAAPATWATFYDIRRYGGLQIFLRAMVGGCTLVLSQAGEPLAHHLARLGMAGVTHISGTPSHWRRVLMSDAAHKMAPGYVRLSGEIADAAVLDGLAALYPGVDVAHAYASTEGGVAFAVEDGREGLPAQLIEGPQGSVTLKVVDGALHIRSNRTALRYLAADAPPLHDADGFVDTGDMMERRDDRYYFVGRRGGIINVGGLKVHPEEIEAIINGEAGVRMSLVKGRKNPFTGAIVTAEVIPQDEAALNAGVEADALRETILARCRAILPGHKVPATLKFVAALDVLPTGKMARRDA